MYRCKQRFFGGSMLLLFGFIFIISLVLVQDAMAKNSLEQSTRKTWFVDEARFHASAHGSLECADCHDISLDKHPTLHKINQPKSSAFNMQTCLNCHADIEGELATGLHGGRKVFPKKDYTNCVSCHNPHEYMTGAARKNGYTPAIPMTQACGTCHDKQEALPKFSAETASCLSCHSNPNSSWNQHAKINNVESRDSKTIAQIESKICLTCHSTASTHVLNVAKRMSPQEMADSTHAQLQCISCHVDAAKYPHSEQKKVDCLQCHVRHDEATINDAHSRVSCGSCHIAGATPILKDGMVDYKLNGNTAQAHMMSLPKGEASCVKCHSTSSTEIVAEEIVAEKAITVETVASEIVEVKTVLTNNIPPVFVGNGKVGATAYILPPKSILCMGCHASTFTVQDTPSRIGLGVFLIGFFLMALAWFSVSGLGRTTKTVNAQHNEHAGHKACWKRWYTLLADIFVQQRLYVESPKRWLMHALIFFPFLFRFTWGLVALLGSMFSPESQWPWILLQKDWGLTAFLYDLSGLALLLGIILAIRLNLEERKNQEMAKKPDWLALVLLGAITVTGFVLEGIRIALTQMPSGSEFAFIGYVIAQFFATMPQKGLAVIYGQAWYIHAIFTAVTVAYIPFSQLRHIFTTPIFMIVQTLRGHNKPPNK